MEDVSDAPEPSKATVHDWVKGYTGLALRFLAGEVGEDGTPATATDKRVKADVGDHWVADELVLKVGGRKYWCWNVREQGHPVRPCGPPVQLPGHLRRHRGV